MILMTFFLVELLWVLPLFVAQETIFTVEPLLIVNKDKYIIKQGLLSL